jgi:hypothetical protein
MSVCQPYTAFGRGAAKGTRVFVSLFVVATAAATLLFSNAARAQSITAATQINPERSIPGQDLGQSTRPINLNPFGIHYSDCLENMVFTYSVTLSGFPGANSDNMQVWATNTGDCSADTARGVGVDSQAATCWLINVGLTQPNLQSASTRQFSFPVRALVGPQTGTIPQAGTLVGDLGLKACQTQTSFAATAITVWFLPLTSVGTLDPNGTAYSAPVIAADLVGPPAPANTTIGDGDTLFVVNWTPNTDADTAGYDVFIDPPPGGAVSAVEAGSVAPTKTLYCPDTGAPATTIASDDGSVTSADASADAAAVLTTALAGSADAGSGCFYVNVAPSPMTNGASACTSAVLTTGTVTVEGGVVATDIDSSTSEFVNDEGGILVETDSGIESGIGGIATIPCQNLVGGGNCNPASAAAYTNTGNPSVTGLNIGQYVIKGLTNGKTYDVVVSAVDGSGNVGPPSTCVTDYPAPVIDFFKLYRQDGGQAGGSFCALEAVGEPAGAPIVGVGLGAVAFTMVRRRRNNRRSRG